MPVRVVENGPVPIVTLAGGTVAIAVVDVTTAFEIMQAGDELEYIDQIDVEAWEHIVSSTELSKACVRVGLAATGARIQIIVSQEAYATAEDRYERVVLQDSGEGKDAKMLITGVPVAHIATVAHLLYARLSYVDPIEFYSTPDWIGAIMTAESLKELEAARVERYRAAVTIARMVSYRIDEIKARLWSPGSRLVAKNVVKSGMWPQIDSTTL